MPDQPTPKPLTAEDEAQFRAYVNLTGHRAVSRAIDHIDASRSETAALRESLAAAEKQRDEARKELGERITTTGPFHEDESGFGINWVKDGLAYSLSIESDGADYTVFEGHRVVGAKEWKNPAFARLAAELAEARKVVERLPKDRDGLPLLPGDEVKAVLDGEECDCVVLQAGCGLVMIEAHDDNPGGGGCLDIDPSHVYRAARDSGKASGGGGE